jgi:hypothetical protein
MPKDKTGIQVQGQSAGSTAPDPDTDPQLSCLFEIQIRIDDTDPNPNAKKLAKITLEYKSLVLMDEKSKNGGYGEYEFFECRV